MADMTSMEATLLARDYLRGKSLTYDEITKLWKLLKMADELGVARQVLNRVRQKKGVIDAVPTDMATRKRLCQQEALLTSKDRELPSTIRHDRALGILQDGIGDLDDPALDGDVETLSIAGGIHKRRWTDLGQIGDLQRSARFYDRAATGPIGDDGYAQINAAFMNDLLAQTGDDPVSRRARAQAIRQLLLDKLPAVTAVAPGSAWFNAATRAEALFGLGRYAEAAQAVSESPQKPEPWALETTAKQIATLAHLQQDHPLDIPEIRRFFEALLPGAADAARSAVIGKVGLALSGGGFRASFFHLGVLARLAELNVLRHVDVLSCVSGGSIVGACYWLMLRQRLLRLPPLERQDYVSLVEDLIAAFATGVDANLRGAVQPSKASVVWRFLQNERGALDPEKTAAALEDQFYRPLLPTAAERCMHDLPFTPADHSPAVAQSQAFHPGKHNWLRANKVPVLVLNATTVNTGHAWQFTPTWMGESPWAIHEAADSIRRLEWSWYAPNAGWKMEVGRAVAASACVPGVFAPLRIEGAYDEGVNVQLVDGGVHDNQGTVSLLALDCNVVLVSDACGQLLLEADTAGGIGGLLAYANRSMSTLMERIRLANYADLAARRQTGLLRALMFLHMKAGLDADTIHLKFSQEAYDLQREPLSPSGVRKDFQEALAQLRTDLDVFSEDERNALMACGYQMACWAFTRDVAHLKELADEPVDVAWPFMAMLREITSTDANTPRRAELLAAFEEGSRIKA